MEIELEINDFVWLRGEGCVSVFWKVVHDKERERMGEKVPDRKRKISKERNGSYTLNTVS